MRTGVHENVNIDAEESQCAVLGPGWCWAGAGLPQSAGRSGAATTSTTSSSENIATTTTTMSEEHFDQWEHYNFEEKVVRSRNSGEEPVLVVLLPPCLSVCLGT